ncbi:phage tail sheath subtilisin-like domain-containing protein [Pseudomonas aeruginosa]|uniref:phage tail sheath family protein n=1 Tax=Pseudomonas aeruginosa TaxID=287 RepID=UPI002ADD347B|nr:phage tail sheath C-terminal domain-containing protein [Pseudomonas aeruginosa]MEA0988993.1 phage tail sheath subtilisin-like domain-containing protein [Pseudomonas aeruginosa]
MADYKVPGVYVEEPFGLSLSIQTGQTAVPVFAFDASKSSWGGAIGEAGKDKVVIDKSGVTEFASWLEVSSVRQRFEDKKGKVSDFDTAVASDPLYQSLRLYFMNGGGHCYIVAVDKLDALVPALDDVTLLVQAGVDGGSPKGKFAEKVATLCGLGKTYFALFDGPTIAPEVNSIKSAQDAYPSSAYAAVYYPWLSVKGVGIDVPPSGAVAGVYAQVDRDRGVWKAPANVELVGAEPKFKVSDEVDAQCNAPDGGKSINVIRTFRGTGPLIWGARTLQSNTGTWRYVPVRRLFNAAEKDIKTAMSMALFEPNSAPTWERVRGAVESYVHSLWKQGALLGDVPEHAYFVQIGLGTTMTQDDVNSGKMKIKVGLAAVRPAEFIVLQLTQDVVPG